MDSQAPQQQNSLGRDFLTHLCYLSDASAGQIEVPGSGERLSLWIDGKIILEDDRDAPPNKISYSGSDLGSRDLKQAIRSGKKVRESRFRIEKGENTWTFTLKADGLEVSGLNNTLNWPGTRYAVWVLFCIFSLSTLGNLKSSSRTEKAIMTPVAVILAVSCLLIALG